MGVIATQYFFMYELSLSSAMSLILTQNIVMQMLKRKCILQTKQCNCSTDGYGVGLLIHSIFLFCLFFL